MTSAKSCFFLGCSNTSSNCPRKIFLAVPQNREVRKLWYKSARNTTEVPSTALVYCCEDHFNLETDCENWQYYKTFGTKIRIKKGAVPRDLGRTTGPSEESQLSRSAEKRKIEFSEKVSKRLKTDPASFPREHGPRRRLFESEAGPSSAGPSSAGTSLAGPSTSLELSTQKRSTLESSTTPTKEVIAVAVNSPSGKFEVSCAEQHKPKTSRTKTKFTQTSWQVRSVAVLADFKKESINKATNTGIVRTLITKLAEKDSDSDASPRKVLSEQSSSYYPSSDSGSTTFKFPGQGNGELGRIEKHTRMYTGLPPDVYFIVEKLCSKGQMSKMDVLLTLKKIRTNDSFSRIAIDFGYSSSYPSKIFAKTLPQMANLLQDLVFWPSAEHIKKIMPQQFWANYKDVQSIIDCFEIEIQKPSGALNQAVTWSQYKSCNTAKYLISSTPSGLVNFISAGFGGRTSDKEIVMESGYLDVLPNGCHVLADRGFKQIAHLIEEKNCKLLRPPSVSTSAKPSKEEVRQTKSIASLRIHIERVIRRLREFRMISPHACISIKLLPLLDYIVITACAIINLQGPIIVK